MACGALLSPPITPGPALELLVLMWVPNSFDLWILHGFEALAAFSQGKVHVTGFRKATSLSLACCVLTV